MSKAPSAAVNTRSATSSTDGPAAGGAEACNAVIGRLLSDPAGGQAGGGGHAGTDEGGDGVVHLLAVVDDDDPQVPSVQLELQVQLD